MHSSRSITKALLAVLGAASVVHAHSWIEQLMIIAPNGTLVGQPGYPRGNVQRSDPGFGDPVMVNLITGAPNDPMCKDSQKSASQSESSPRLKAPPGADVSLRFQENGHVTLPETQLGKPKNRGDIFVYGTTQPKDNELFSDVHGVWTADGKGGDGRGVLLVKAAYDDGQCYQVNGGAISTERQKKFAHTANQLMGADLWCQTDVRLPADAPPNKPYTLYWVWIWPTAGGVDPNLPQGKNETYTTCMDIDVQSSNSFSLKATGGGFIQGQPIENAAVPAQFSKLGDQPAAPASQDQAPPAAEPDAPLPADSTSTTILPIPAPDAGPFLASSAPSQDASATTQQPSAAPAGASQPSNPISADSPAVSTTMVTVTATDVVTSIDRVTVTVPSVPNASDAPKIRGRNPIF